MSARLRLVAQLVAVSALVVSGARLAGRAPQNPPTFRAAVDLIAVDVEVIDASGHPVVGVRPDQFAVKIDGRSRRVVTADLVTYGSIAASAPASVAAAAAERPGGVKEVGPNGRVIVIAVDLLSFNLSTSRW